jgi:hypothetical protein
MYAFKAGNILTNLRCSLGWVQKKKGISSPLPIKSPVIDEEL